MATTGEATGTPGFSSIANSQIVRTLILLIGAAAIVGIMVGVWMWSQKPDLRVLFSNYSDKDGGAIVASLQQMNIPYKIAEGGGAILVPGDQVHDIRLRLASQGLPKGGGVGFELMESQKLGVSQFLEQVNFQRALEGEMARSIQSIGAVHTARVHLALHKASVFVRDQQKPTASVLLNLHPGRTLDQNQVSAIVHLVASGVPNLLASNVTVVDQNGSLLSNADKPLDGRGLDPAQIKYVQELQQSIAKRVESIIIPIVGVGNVRAEATAEVDFSRSEQAAETYKPNLPPNQPSVRSQQNTETQTLAGNATASGVPGALTNQPPVPATAPLTTPPTGATAGAVRRGATPVAPPMNTHKDTTTNYEVDKTIRYVQQPMGGLKRLTVAVVVNYKKEIKNGQATFVPLTDAEKTQITDLVKEAMGFSKERGDSLNVLNAPFAMPEKVDVVELPLWKRPSVHAMGITAGKYILGGAVILYLFLSVLRPMMRKISQAFTFQPAVRQDAAYNAPPPSMEAGRTYQQNLEVAKQMARQDPKVVANVVKGWVGSNE
ncbi:MAG: flagellar basal body M-ring protein FliF [Oxalobacter sp.]|nr:MAG: flagellar basal body M-ring protein FliF [Oxalobacter sp.]